MLNTEIEAYLSAALDQEACKATLTAALISRVMSLRARGIMEQKIIGSLENLGAEDYQLNDDVIASVIKLMETGAF